MPMEIRAGEGEGLPVQMGMAVRELMQLAQWEVLGVLGIILPEVPEERMEAEIVVKMGDIVS